MRTTFAFFTSVLISLTLSSQILTYKEMEGATKKPKIDFTEYHAINGEIFKVGDMIKIGTPSSNSEYFQYIIDTDGFSSATKAGLYARDWESEIKKFKIGGTKRQGFQVMAVGKTEVGMTNYWIFIDKAIESGEIESSIMSREEAIDKLKEAKDLLDLEMMTQEEYDKIKDELAPIIKN